MPLLEPTARRAIGNVLFLEIARRPRLFPRWLRPDHTAAQWHSRFGSSWRTNQGGSALVSEGRASGLEIGQIVSGPTRLRWFVWSQRLEKLRFRLPAKG